MNRKNRKSLSHISKRVGGGGIFGPDPSDSTRYYKEFFFVWQVSLTEDYDILQVVGEGWFAKILLAEHRVSGTEIVLKALPKVLNSAGDFYREFHYSIHLSVHRNIITSVDVAFETPGFYVFAQVCKKSVILPFFYMFHLKTSCLKRWIFLVYNFFWSLKFLSKGWRCILAGARANGRLGRQRVRQWWNRWGAGQEGRPAVGIGARFYALPGSGAPRLKTGQHSRLQIWLFQSQNLWLWWNKKSGWV